MLKRLLEGLDNLTFRKCPISEIVLVVVDNDPERSAQEACKNTIYKWPLIYVSEPRRGIATARNRAIKEARGADFIAFIDDDEVPKESWLDELLWVQSQYDADLVSGPVLPVYPEGVPDWIIQGKFFDRPVDPTGTLLTWCRTGNLLIQSKVFDTVPEFDERLNFTGGEDALFSTRVHRAGYRMVSSADAVVFESVTIQRISVASLLKRSYQYGSNYVLVQSLLGNGTLRTRLMRLVKACIKACMYCARLGLSMFGGRIPIVRTLRKLCNEMGIIMKMLGYEYQPYRMISNKQ